MCGRYNLYATSAEIQAFFDLFRDEDLIWPARYNIAPTQSVLAVRQTGSHRIAVPMRWGLIPFWASDTKLAASMINARAETLAEKPAFRAAFQRRRCLIPANGFYEWQTGTGKTKQPFHIHQRDHQILAFAGLWERWDKGGQPVESCTIITTSANDLMQPLHDRMPVILPSSQWAAWLDTQVPASAVSNFLVPCAADDLQAVPISSLVNHVKNETIECLRPQP
jgi:putative SOS response-associated peptidase YedK